ncbi:hypothetical protein HispidOSU_009386, partial [Sigmodon hispidus]
KKTRKPLVLVSCAASGLSEKLYSMPRTLEEAQRLRRTLNDGSVRLSRHCAYCPSAAPIREVIQTPGMSLSLLMVDTMLVAASASAADFNLRLTFYLSLSACASFSNVSRHHINSPPSTIIDSNLLLSRK